MISENDENEIVKLEVYKLAIYSIETYARKFKADGISQEDMKSLFTAVKEAVSSVEETTDKVKYIKDEVLSRFDSADSAIENAYREQVN